MLHINNLTKKYDNNYIFKNISFSIDNNSIVSLTGKNGIGKTTLLNILGGMIKFEGKIEAYNKNIRSNYEEYMKKISFIANTSFLYEYLTLNETIKLVYSLLNKDCTDEEKIFIDELILILGISNYTDTIIKNLSLGTRQKVQIILNLLNRPKILLFDEPFVNLDFKSVDNILTFLISYLEENNGIIIFSTHSQDNRLLNFTTHTLEIKSAVDVQLTLTK